MAGFLHRVVKPDASPPRIGQGVSGIFGYSRSGPPYVLDAGCSCGAGPYQADYVLEIRIIEESSGKLVGFKAFSDTYNHPDSSLSVPVNAGLHTVQYTGRWNHPTYGAQYVCSRDPAQEPTELHRQARYEGRGRDREDDSPVVGGAHDVPLSFT